jgi:hypothetical protein
MSNSEDNLLFIKSVANCTKRVISRYNVDDNSYNKHQIDNIIYDNRSRIVTKFKENLIWNEPTELLRR